MYVIFGEFFTENRVVEYMDNGLSLHKLPTYELVSFGYMHRISEKYHSDIIIPRAILVLTTLFYDTQKHLYPLDRQGIEIKEHTICKLSDEPKSDSNKSTTIVGPNFMNHALMSNMDVWQMDLKGDWTVPGGSPAKGAEIVLLKEQWKVKPFLYIHPQQRINNVIMSYPHSNSPVPVISNVYSGAKITNESVFSLCIDLHTYEISMRQNGLKINLHSYNVDQCEALYAGIVLHDVNTSVEICELGFRKYSGIDLQTYQNVQRKYRIV